VGYTAHGGVGSGGFLGSSQHRWAEDAGLLYGEMLGTLSRLPHPWMTTAGGVPEATMLVLPPMHASLDATTKPDEHNLERLRQQVPARLAAGELVVVMNHPDIHIEQLRELLGELDLDTTWRATLEEVAHWQRSVKFGGRVFGRADDLELELSAPVKADVSVRVRLPGQPERVLTLPAGAQSLRLARSVANRSAPVANDWPDIAAEFVPLLRAWYEDRGQDPDSAGAASTISINTDRVPKRVDPLLNLLQDGWRTLEDARVLEAGCGFGAFSAYVAWRARPRQVVPIDVDDSFLEVARKGVRAAGLECVHPQKADMRDLSAFADGFFDAIIINNAFIYLARAEDMDVALHELHRVLAPGGRIVLYHANKWRLREPFSKDPIVHLLPAPLARGVSRLTGWRHNHGRVRLVSPLELSRRAQRAGFVEREVLASRATQPMGLRRYLLDFYAFRAERPAAPAADVTASRRS
jgi:SAM-dependent methyltransferase